MGFIRGLVIIAVLVGSGASAFGGTGKARIATFNAYLMPDLTAFGYPLKLSPYNPHRRRKLCEAIARQFRQGLDVILLQEVWEPSNRRAVAGCGFPFSLDLDRPKALLDSGLLILSRWPLSHGRRVRFLKNGFPSKISEDGEFLTKKSFYLAQVAAPWGTFTVATTHLVSFYDFPDRYLAQRADQMEQLASVLEKESGPWVVGGDLNFSRGSGQWKDWLARLPDLTSPGPDPVCTVCTDNVLTDSGHGQLDYLFASKGVGAVDGRLLWTETGMEPGGKTIPLSDHYGWQGTFLFP